MEKQIDSGYAEILNRSIKEVDEVEKLISFTIEDFMEYVPPKADKETIKLC